MTSAMVSLVLSVLIGSLAIGVGRELQGGNASERALVILLFLA
jgi:hypothetical protein